MCRYQSGRSVDKRVVVKLGVYRRGESAMGNDIKLGEELGQAFKTLNMGVCLVNRGIVWLIVVSQKNIPPFCYC